MSRRIVLVGALILGVVALAWWAGRARPQAVRRSKSSPPASPSADPIVEPRKKPVKERRGFVQRIGHADGRTTEHFDSEEDQEYRRELERAGEKRFFEANREFLDALIRIFENEGEEACYQALLEVSGRSPRSIEDFARVLAAIEQLQRFPGEYPEFSSRSVSTLTRLAQDPRGCLDVRHMSLAMLLGFQSPHVRFRANPLVWKEGDWGYEPRPKEADLILPFAAKDLMGSGPETRSLTAVRAAAEKDPSVGRYLIQLASNPKEHLLLREIAVLGLAEFGVDATVELRALALRDVVTGVRMAALQTLLRKKADVGDLVVEMVRNDASPDARRAALECVAHLREIPVGLDRALAEISSASIPPGRSGLVPSEQQDLHEAALLASRECWVRTRDPALLSRILSTCEQYVGVPWGGSSPVLKLAKRAAKEGPEELKSALRGFAAGLPAGADRETLFDALRGP